MEIGIGKRIKKRRTDLGLTQSELAERMGYKSKAAICKVENGEDNITSDRVSKFAEALECSPAYLMGWQEQIRQLQKQFEPVSEQMSGIAKMISESLDFSSIGFAPEYDFQEALKELSSQYSAKDIEKAFRFTKAFLKATPEQQKIALEILQLHREEP